MDRPRLLLTIFAGILLAGLAALGAFATGARAGPNCDIDPAIDSEEQQVLELINDYRQGNGLGPLALSATLTRAAAWKSQHMADNNYFAHDDLPIARTWDDRIRDCGYGFTTWIGENIAAGNSSAAATFEQWRNSAGHNQNMLNSNYNAIGIGRAFGANTPYGWYWTTDFGGVADGAPPPLPTNTLTGTPTNLPTETPLPPPTSTPAFAPTPTATGSPTPTASPQPPAATATSSPPPTATATSPLPTATSSPPPTATATSPLPPPGPPDPDGDVSCAGGPDSLDAALVLQLDAGLIASLPCLATGDVNGDGGVDAIDALVILQYAAGLIASLPI